VTTKATEWKLTNVMPGPHRRFTLGTMMLAVVASGVLVYWIRIGGEGRRDLPGFRIYLSIFDHLRRGNIDEAIGQTSHTRLAWILAFLSTFLIATKLLPATPRGVARRLGRTAFGLAVVLSMHLIWAHYRVFWGDPSDLYHRPVYVDQAILALERWYDARNPVTVPYTLKLHGEFPRVAETLARVVVVMALINGILLGIVRKTEPIDDEPYFEPMWKT
jgi:hypothetical protein